MNAEHKTKHYYVFVEKHDKGYITRKFTGITELPDVALDLVRSVLFYVAIPGHRIIIGKEGDNE